MPTINNIDGFVHTIAYNPPWREAVQAHLLRQEQPNRFAEFLQLTQKKNRPVNERLGTAQTETDRRLKRMDDHPGSLEGNDYERKVRYRVMAQDVPATRPQSPLSRGAGGIAKAAHAHPWEPGTTATRR